MYKIAGDLRKTAKRLNFKCNNLKQQLKHMESVTNSPDILKAKLNQHTYNFVMSQLRCQPLKPKGRRYTLDEKILFLSFLKQSPKGYKLLRRLFAAPSRKTLTNLLGKIPFYTGINDAIMKSVSERVKKMTDTEKCCAVIFDEMAIDPTVQYNKKKDFVEGFQDNGGDRNPLIADKVMVFMARGIFKKWKQPLAYYFNDGGMKSDMLTKTIKDVVLACQQAGLKVWTLICDQGAPNVAAINKLYAATNELFVRRGEDNRLFGVSIGNEEVVPIYDPPHLLKCIRNNFFKYNLSFKWRNEKKEIAKWDHIKKVYEIDSQEADEYRCCKNLSIHHVENTKKMKVSMAAQVFSNTLASVMKGMVKRRNPDDPDDLPIEAESTAEFILFMDYVFDSVNGSFLQVTKGKTLKCAVRKTSGHKAFWAEAIQVFSTMEFFNSHKAHIVPPSVKNWIHTLKAFSYLWDKCEKSKISFLCPRNLNQDPLENFFGSIRSHGIRNINPNAAAFVNSLKSLVINNFITSHSKAANCENDNLKGLDDLKHMLTSDVAESNIDISFPEIVVAEYKPDYHSLLKKGTLTYIAGFVAKKVLKQIGLCQQCRQDLVGGDRSQAEYFIVNARAYSAKALLAPSTNFNLFFQKCIFIISNILPQLCYKQNIIRLIKIVLKNLCNEDIFMCEKHDVKKIFWHYVSVFHLHVWIKNVNSILKGKQALTKSSTDTIKIYASRKFEKHRSYLKKVQRMKNLQN